MSAERPRNEDNPPLVLRWLCRRNVVICNEFLKKIVDLLRACLQKREELRLRALLQHCALFFSVIVSAGVVAAVDKDEACIALCRIRSKFSEDSCNTICEICRITPSSVYHTAVPGEPVE